MLQTGVPQSDYCQIMAEKTCKTACYWCEQDGYSLLRLRGFVMRWVKVVVDVASIEFGYGAGGET